ncbi:hypothetical protein BJ165DRAFT_249091 [Panaeolus papilionaceus]|nr:hypothetical protein BJ165DRAFT_249091 [Panaeolus papilionaceus]
MQTFELDDEQHRRVEWPLYLQDVSIPLPTSFIPLLTSNAPPSPADIQLVKDYKTGIIKQLSESKRKEDDIQSKILELQLELTKVKNSRQPLKKQDHACDIILSPFRRLPDDVIHEVFQHCPIYSNANEQHTSGKHFPSTLSQVCRRWRKLTHGTSSLWKDMRLLWPRKHDAMKLYDHFAHFSRSMPLTLTLDGGILHYKDAASNALLFVQRLMSDVAVTRRLEGLEVVGPLLFQVLQTMEGKKFPLLKSCLMLPMKNGDLIKGDVEEGEEEEFDVYFSLNKLLENAPRLVQLCFGGRTMNADSLVDRPQQDFRCWSQLTTLYISSGSIRVNEWHSLLKICRNLERVWAPVTEQEADIDFYLNTSQPYVHPHLREMVLHYEEHYQHILIPFLGFRFPKLDALQVGFHSCSLSDPDMQADLKASDFLDTFPSLETLIIRDTSEVDDGIGGFIPLLESVPTTKSLIICFSGKYVLDFLNFIQKPLNTNRLLLHNLRNLELEYSPSLRDPWSTKFEQRFTAALLRTREQRSLTRSFYKMIVRYNNAVSPHKEVVFWKTGKDMASYLRRLDHEISLMDDVDINVLLETDDYRRVASPLMRRFMVSFEFWKPLL